MNNNWTGERLETFIYNRVSIEHLHRYSIVNEYIKDKVVLDIACGEGYGSNLMSNKASFIYGVDIDTMCVNKAKIKYQKSNIKFFEGNTSKIPLINNSIDVIVSFETIEHHEFHVEMMLEFKRVLKPNGLLIISTPDKLHYSDSRKYYNEYHVKELYKQEFNDLISNYFSKIQLLTQVYINGNSIVQNDNKKNELRLFSGNYLNVNESAVNPMFLIIVASDVDFVQQNSSIFDGGIINYLEILNNIKNSNSYKLGNLLLFPFKKVKQKIKKLFTGGKLIIF